MTRPRTVDEPLPGAVADASTQLGATVGALSDASPVLLVMLRHAGCPFCREAAADVRRQRAAIEESGTTIVLVHQGGEPAGQHFFSRYDLDDLHRVGDPERTLYHAMHLTRGNLWQIGGPKVWVRSLLAALRGHVPGASAQGDAFQMPGTFLLRDRRVVMAYRHASQADRPSYDGIACSV
ncbi:MAG: SelL-related redox protein [Planctomycetota bacterium]